SDDPAYFGGYVDENFAGVRAALRFEDERLVRLARNSFEAAFLEPHERARYVAQVDAFVATA
ncbi:MAG: adenosine deaminase, partial [Candidatus Eremiobacteraeota bacterium]|nr:adenosine deaminase [Candidatus Eremiobacteraeota bacterium]